jgi:hypothetical protein
VVPARCKSRLRASLGILGHTAIFHPKQERRCCHIGGSSPTNGHDRFFMAPKLRAKSQAIAANASDGEVFRVRAVSSQIGWLETSMADAAAGAVSKIELLLSTGAPEQSVAIDDQLKVFESYERGLMATWETPDAFIASRGSQLKPVPDSDGRASYGESVEERRTYDRNAPTNVIQIKIQTSRIGEEHRPIRYQLPARLSFRQGQAPALSSATIPKMIHGP